MSFKELIEKFKEIIMPKAKGRATGKKRAGGKAKIIVGTKEANNVRVAAEIPGGKPPKVIRMLMSLANARGSYKKGHTYTVPHEVRVPTARAWIHSGAAELVED